MNLSTRQQEIISIIASQGQVAISQVKNLLSHDISIATLNREMAKLVDHNCLSKVGAGRTTQYIIAPYYKLFTPVNSSDYFDLEPDARNAATEFNHTLLTSLQDVTLFTAEEQKNLSLLKDQYQMNIASLSPTLYQKELERLTIELSWKSSQIEGNTYSLLETERLFKEKQEADNKTKEEAVMLLNHKDTINYLLKHKNLATTLDIRLLEEVHSLLIKDMHVSRNIRSRAVGITGTAYKPLDNTHQIRESLECMCDLINTKNSGFEKALLAVVLISYIQPFEDGNKRTGRMISNALLIADDACPLSYRSVDSLEYKKAMLLFYEQNNLAAFKDIFIEQNNFGVKNYFQ
ncbi:Fic family protein [Aquimarina macrocephali]|uniref:Fic family protein n=1 Tax=Aquimarina macrocephali TaxID=666563 RepID=UPI0004655F79|nr:Fic family protein [Aquimarina macrocephali]